MELLTKIQDAIRNYYVLTDKVDEVIAALDARADELNPDLSPHQIGQTVTNILREITHDMHFALMVTPQNQASSQPAPTHDFFQHSARNNHYLNEAKRLIGNVGYLDIRMFPNTRDALETAMAAMAFLANSDALIFDIRQNRGGAPEMIQVILSYLFAEPTHINTFYNRGTDTYTQSWTQPYVAGKNLSHVSVYVLTSSGTGSAGEEFAYDLQQLKRATLVGKTTVGAGHTARVVPLDDEFSLLVPDGRPINPVSGTGWEGVGVVPDIETSPEDALQVAHLHALEMLIEKNEDDATRAYYQWEYETASAQYIPYVVDGFSAYTGDYDGMQITEENGELIYQSPRMKRTLTPIKENILALGDDLRLCFENDQIHMIWRDQARQQTFNKLTSSPV